MNVQPYGRPGDRRVYPRVACTLVCTVANVGSGRVLNVSDGGAFVALPDQHAHLPSQLLLSVALLGSDQAVDVSARVVRVAALSPHGLGVGLQFQDLSEAAAEQIHRYVLGRLLAEIAEIMEDSPRHVDPRNVQVVSGVASVAGTLRDMIAEGPVPGLLFQRDVGELVDLQLFQVSGAAMFVQLRDAAARLPAVGDHVHITLTRGTFNAHAHSQVLDRSGARVTLEVPANLTRFELRRSQRRSPGPQEMFVSIPLPYPPGKKLRREVLDISATGLAFRMRPDEALLLPGTPLREVVVSGANGDGETRKTGQVMHVTPVQGDAGAVEYLRVGLDFGIADEAFTKGVRPRGASEKKSLGFVEKMGLLIGRLIPRKAPAPTGPGTGGVEVVRYPNRRREDIVAILNTTPRGDGRKLLAPVIIIPPAHSKRKESTSGLALTLVENFARRRQDVVVLRFDGVRNLGESYKDPDCREHGREAMRMSLSQAVDDIQATLDYVYDNPIFSPTQVVLVSFSLQGVVGRRAVWQDKGKRIHYWLGINGAPAAQEVIRNASGGIDYVSQHASGKLSGIANILGVTGDIDHFCADLLREGLAFMADAKREIAEIPIPVTWLLGRFDAWIDPATIREFMAVAAPGARELVELDCGHMPLSSVEALTLFHTAVRQIWRFLFREDIDPITPDPRELVRARNAEWRRVPKSPLPDRRRYWQEYLLGDSSSKLAYDVLNACDEYNEFIERELELLDVRPEHVVCDLGCGTGNLSARLLRRRGARGRPPCARLNLVDFVPGALDEAERKLRALADERGLALPEVARHCVNIDISPVRTLRRFLAGELYGYDALRGIIKGLTGYSIDMWKAAEDWRLHDVLRGRELDKQDLAYLAAALPADEQDVALDFNRMARWLRGRLGPQDLVRDARPRFERGQAPAVDELQLARLSIRPGDQVERLPFGDATFDRVACSLVLSYLSNPIEVLRELHRVVRPGGRIVVSTMQPDFDMSRIYQNLLHRLQSDPNMPLPPGVDRGTFLRDVRAFLSSAAFLSILAEEGQFAFFSREELIVMVERAGFRRVETVTAFGDPPQAIIAVGHR
ncbi:PilZ domain-containing protein [Nannocystis pusilla]|uniref:PilZ domain-containing protein n=1 Tax=Nannocystis pusilla TaxID=889268 RepID=A0A9X3EIG9_9BACT|nr:PilZ domain-containing protein [Nannocystis pusilla]